IATVEFTTEPVGGPEAVEASRRPECARTASRLCPAATNVTPCERPMTTPWIRARWATPAARTTVPFTRTRVPRGRGGRVCTVRSTPDLEATARLPPELPTTTPVNVPAKALVGNMTAAVTTTARRSFFTGHLSFVESGISSRGRLGRNLAAHGSDCRGN